MTVSTGVAGINIPAFQAACYSMMTDTAILIYKVSTDDSTGMQTDTVTVPIPMTCRLQPATDKDRTLDDAGQVISGERVGYFKPSYSHTVGLTTYTVAVEEDMVITHKTINYRVQKVLKNAHIGDDNIYIKAILKII